jgi:hypothetical protein
MKRSGFAAIIVAIGLGSTLARAESHHVLVLRTEGTVDEATRAKLDTQVLRLAKNIQGNVEAGDISLTDATALVGCSWNDTGCKDQVLTTMGVDELVASSASASGADLRLTVRRLPRGGGPKEASTTIPTGQPPDAKMNADIGPLFGLAAPPVEKLPAAPTSPVTSPPPTNTGAISTGTPRVDTSTEPIVTPPETPPAPAPTPTVTAAPNNQVTTLPEGEGSGSRVEVLGIAGSGALAVVGLVMWIEAGNVQNDINNAPTKTPRDFQNLKDLESKGDTYSMVGNVCVIGGAVLGVVSGYFLWRHHHAATNHQARRDSRTSPSVGTFHLRSGEPAIARSLDVRSHEPAFADSLQFGPAVLDHGVGLTVGGAL